LWPFDVTALRALAVCIVVCILALTLFTVIGTERERALERAQFLDAVHVGDLDHAGLDEASGMASSRLRDDLLWLLNDSDHEPLLYAVTLNGAHRGLVRISGVENRDWEDMASFRLGDTAFLLIADVGDNEAGRKQCMLHVVREPHIGEVRLEAGYQVEVAWTVHFRYEDGQHDCEAVAVDVARREVLLLSKREVPAVLYRVPLEPSGETSLSVARRVVGLDGIPQPTSADLEEDWVGGRHRSQPTAMDISPDGDAVAVLTYRHAYVFACRNRESWGAVFGRAPRILRLPRMSQPEALCYGADGRTIFVTSERRPAPLYRLDKVRSARGS
jgi:hypothetical protein